MNCRDFVRQQETRYRALLDPVAHLATHGYDSAPNYENLIVTLQNSMHASLSEYLGMAWIYPFLERKSYLSAHHVERYMVRGLLSSRPLINAAVRHFGIFGATLAAVDKLMLQTTPREIDLAVVFGCFYAEFQAVTALLPHTAVGTKPACRNFCLEDYPLDLRAFMRPLVRFRNDALALKQVLSGVYLHGSLATGDFVPSWSDVDTLLIVRSEALTQAESLVTLRHKLIRAFRHFLAVDPLQLHGYFVITEPDLAFYPQTYFPLVLFNHARSFYAEDQPLVFNCRDSRPESLRILWGQVKSFLMRASDHYYGFQTHFERKAFLHSVFSFPLYYLQANGRHVYKRDSFALARPDFPSHLWPVIELATSIMRNWKHDFQVNHWTRGVGEINVKLWMKLLNRLLDSRRAPGILGFKELDQHAELLINGMAQFALCAWQAVQPTADACLAHTEKP